MKTLYQSYVRAFIKFADVNINKFSKYTEIIVFANLLTEKANQLIKRATINMIEAYTLQKELFELGKVYIKKFSERLNPLAHKKDGGSPRKNAA